MNALITSMKKLGQTLSHARKQILNFCKEAYALLINQKISRTASIGKGENGASTGICSPTVADEDILFEAFVKAILVQKQRADIAFRKRDGFELYDAKRNMHLAIKMLDEFEPTFLAELKTDLNLKTY